MLVMAAFYAAYLVLTQRISEDDEGDTDYSRENESCVTFSNNQIADEEAFTESSDDEYGDIANYDCSTDKKSEV
ncbi:hypothetical protein ACMD2_21601 [Ananas comosus]|uniref:Uncharacterized protein n=1 Tax=Ananas comosus TaxID=4615 RepID=A0A199VPG3_ANACO|nr:hypothetical protein ACMD2_21601 [Ananas comosus]